MRQGWTVVLATLTLVPAVGGRVLDDRRQAASPARLTGMVLTTDISPQPVRRAIAALTGGDRPWDITPSATTMAGAISRRCPPGATAFLPRGRRL